MKDLQKASLLKRFSAFLLDGVLIFVVFIALMLFTSWAFGYDAKLDSLENRMQIIHNNHRIDELEEKHKVSFNNYPYLTEEEIDKLPEEVVNAFEACYKELNEDTQSIKLYETIMTLSLMIVSFSLLGAFLLLEFAIPLLLKNGQTLGKKMFSLAVMRTDSVKISTKVLFIRAILGKYTIGTMVPVLMLLCLGFGMAPIMPLMILLLVFLLQIVLMITSKTNSPIHDSLASTVVVDFLSQKIFETAEERDQYRLSIHNEDEKEE